MTEAAAGGDRTGAWVIAFVERAATVVTGFPIAAGGIGSGSGRWRAGVVIAGTDQRKQEFNTDLHGKPEKPRISWRGNRTGFSPSVQLRFLLSMKSVAFLPFRANPC
jgi:hypothetical protein